jgi:catechol 2,3-dioxygenase-like lactoylglutathione lyase family enzyme
MGNRHHIASLKASMVTKEGTVSESTSEIEYGDAVKMYVYLRVTDLDEAIAFYKRVLGLELLWNAREYCDHDEMLHVEMSLPCAGARLVIGQAATNVENYPSGYLLLSVQHLSAVQEHLVANGVDVRPLVAEDDLPSLKCGRDVYHHDFFVMRDPFGNEIFFGGHN